MKRIFTYCLLASAILSFSACNNNGKSSENKDENKSSAEVNLNQLTNDPNGSPLRLYFNLKEVGQTDSTITYLANSISNKDTVGFNVEVQKGIDAGITTQGTPDEELGFTTGSFKFSSAGAISNKLVSVLGDLYGVQTDDSMTSQPIVPLVFSSNREKVDLSKSTSFNFKMFFNQQSGDAAEFFAVLDTYRKSFELTEKDSTFRTAFLNAIRGK